MKKLIVILLAIVLAFAAVVGIGAGKETLPSSVVIEGAEVTPEEQAEAINEAAEVAQAQALDYDRLYAANSGDAAVMRFNGIDVTWDEYYAELAMNAKQLEDYFAQLAAYYGTPVTWADSYDGTVSYGELPSQLAEDTLRHYSAIRLMANGAGVKLTDEQLAQLDDEQLAKNAMGEEATVEELADALEQQLHMDIDAYKRTVEINFLYANLRDHYYGKDGALASDSDIMAYLNEQGYMSVAHILLKTVGGDGQELDEAALSEKKAQADKLYAELTAIDDDTARMTRFKELMAEYNEDGGEPEYGYTFLPGMMVAEFEDAAKALKPFEVSEPVKSSYGYHVLIGQPLGTESILTDSGSTARFQYAVTSFSNDFEQAAAALTVDYLNGFNGVDVSDFVK